MPPFRIAHLSDPHLPPPPAALIGLRGKQRLSALAWRRKRHHHRPEVLAALVADVAAARPDHVAVTGDLTNFSTGAEYASAAGWLRSLGETWNVTLCPGNHDALSGRDDPGRFAPWRPWLGDAGEDFPYLRRRGGVALIVLSSAVPTNWRLAQGRLGQAQLARLSALLRQTGEAGLRRLVLIHHPVVDSAVSHRKALVDAAAFRHVVAGEGAELILHGHAHRTLFASIPGPDRPVPVLGVPSASMAPGHGEPARWHMIEIDDQPGGFDIAVTARGLGPDAEFSSLGRYRL